MQVHKPQLHSGSHRNVLANRAWKRRANAKAAAVQPNRADRRAPLREAYALAQMQASQEHAQVQDQVQPS